MSTPTELRTQVAIVGAGPVGTTVANYLGLYGVHTLLIDRTTDIVDHPRAVLLDDTLGTWFTLLGYGTDPLVHLDPESRTFWGRIGTRCVTVVESRSGRSRTERHVSGTDAAVVEDCDGSLRDWFANHPGTVAVIRPDRYVAAMAAPLELGWLSAEFERLLSPWERRAQRPDRLTARDDTRIFRYELK
ncbi:FAD-dependent monooxygenase [Streptomyces sp. NPDC021098]|uniref:FAD-dependent monooxygenase n=1 Tax=unclassified Streptomyces TaxID=2593676 RepID=UPI003799A8EB